MKSLFLLLFLTNAHAISLKEIKLKLQKRLNVTSNKHSFGEESPTTVGILDTGHASSVREFRDIASTKKAVDIDGHGSHVTGIILALNSNITAFSERYDHKSFFNFNSYTKALKRLIKKQPKIINISSGGFVKNQKEYELIKNNPKILFIVSAGNHSQNIDKKYYTFFPASYNDLPNIISVANFKDKKTLAFSSNYGSSVLVGTIGTDVPSFDQHGELRILSGTSQAAPIITASVATLMSRYPGITFKQIRHILKINSFKRKETNYGFFGVTSFNLWLNNHHTMADLNNEPPKYPGLVSN
jgi:subtilisin family serine protease